MVSWVKEKEIEGQKEERIRDMHANTLGIWGQWGQRSVRAPATDLLKQISQ